MSSAAVRIGALMVNPHAHFVSVYFIMKRNEELSSNADTGCVRLSIVNNNGNGSVLCFNDVLCNDFLLRYQFLAIFVNRNIIFIFPFLYYRYIYYLNDRFDIFQFNPIALRKAKIVYNFGLSKCNKINVCECT